MIITALTIENFKGIREPVRVEFKPITLLFGPNSAGKSTILQSILLLKQTLQYAPIETALALNGPLVQLGRVTSDMRRDHNVVEAE